MGGGAGGVGGGEGDGEDVVRKTENFDSVRERFWERDPEMMSVWPRWNHETLLGSAPTTFLAHLAHFCSSLTHVTSSSLEIRNNTIHFLEWVQSVANPICITPKIYDGIVFSTMPEFEQS